jgi:hypothetical protein
VNRRSAAAVEALLRRESPAGALRFCRAVLRQVTHPLGASPRPEREAMALAQQLVQVLRDASAGGSPTRAPLEPELLSAIFQNLDLLYEDGFAHADGISLLLIARAWEEDGGPASS